MSTTIDDKLRLFHKAIFEKLENKKAEELKKLEVEKERLIKEKQNELEKAKKAFQKEAEKKAVLKANEIISKEEQKKHSEILKLKNSFIEETVLELKKKLIEFTESQEYSNYFKDSLKNTLKIVKPGDYTLLAREKDLVDFKKDIEEISESLNHIELRCIPYKNDIIGGYILEDSNLKFKYDQTLINILLDNKDKIGVMVTEALK
ncbi:V-type ATP synthase subunit E [Clostridium polynesiense]|uniref:V-type ATP synthase subunit E n=1 Tax=Clostridium polynesiense TaxID=1325933 RepID=UPI0005901749|nr:V-type ATP synthase subunit E family protein [Clostridium polynesiense]